MLADLSHPVAALALFIAGFLTVAVLLPPVIRRAVAGGFVDLPGGRKKHEGAVPPVGGLVIFPVFMILAVISGIAVPGIAGVFTAFALLLVIGGCDDRYGLSARFKFLTQFVAAVLLVFGGDVRVTSMGDLFGFGPFGLGPFSAVMSLIAVVLLINAVNLMDGLDGLAAGIGFIIILALLVCAVATGAGDKLALLALALGCLGGFLLHNMRRPGLARARVFLGDAGSLCLGVMLAWLCIDMVKINHTYIYPMGVAWLLALPIFDICGQFARRVSQGRHPFDPDHDHFHHHFIYAGLSPGRATAVILTLVAGGALLALIVQFMGWPQAWLTYPWIAFLFAHIYMSMRPHRFRRVISRLVRAQDPS